MEYIYVCMTNIPRQYCIVHLPLPDGVSVYHYYSHLLVQGLPVPSRGGGGGGGGAGGGPQQEQEQAPS